MNLVPETSSNTFGYWCTWGLQNYLSATGAKSNAFGFTGHSLVGEAVTEENMKKHAFDLDFLTKVRKDLFVVYDLGWDIPLGTNLDGNHWKMGSIEAATDKFPSFTGGPAERLKCLNDFTKNAGWKGAGIWVPSNIFGDGKDGQNKSEAEQREFFRERMIWSKEAGIGYWKIDYGRHGGDVEWRRKLTELGREVYPELLIEQAANIAPLNDTICAWDPKDVKNTGRFKIWYEGKILNQAIKTVEFSDVFRTYDVSASLSIPTTLDRVSELLKEFSATNNGCILNCENEPFLGAALGCAIGIMSSVYQNNIIIQPVTTKENPVLNQCVRALRWQRIAPAWGVGIGENTLDPVYLEDTWDFSKRLDWIDWLDGQIIKQVAPARVSRGMDLPEVKTDDNGDVPYVLCSKHPNGAVSVATLPRASNVRGMYYPKAIVEIDIKDADKPIGVFGKYERIVFKLQAPFKKEMAVWAQDLADDKAVNVTSQLEISGNEIVISGKLLEKLCNTTDEIEDAPGVVFVISGNK